MEVKDLPVAEIHADDSFNCRGEICAIDVVDLAKDIEAKGLIQPVVVVPYTAEEQLRTGFRFKLIAGFRRFMAHKLLLKYETVKAIINESIKDEITARMFNLSENLHRADLNIIQEARALQELRRLGMTLKDAGEKLGKSFGWAQVRTMLLALPKDIQAEAAAGIITQNQIRSLYSINSLNAGDPEKVALYKAVRKIKDKKITGQEAVINPYKAKLSAKHQRNRGEIFRMMEYIQAQLPNGTYTVAMAWCAGEIDNAALFEELKAFALTIEKEFVPPSEQIMMETII